MQTSLSQHMCGYCVSANCARYEHITHFEIISSKQHNEIIGKYLILSFVPSSAILKENPLKTQNTFGILADSNSRRMFKRFKLSLEYVLQIGNFCRASVSQIVINLYDLRVYNLKIIYAQVLAQKHANLTNNTTYHRLPNMSPQLYCLQTYT